MLRRVMHQEIQRADEGSEGRLSFYIFLLLQHRLAHSLDRLFNPPKRTVDLRRISGETLASTPLAKQEGSGPPARKHPAA
jgi:hypothetical protein